MKILIVLCVLSLAIFSCDKAGTKTPDPELIIEGTWQMISGTTIEEGDTTVVRYTGEQSMIKILNSTHFSFLNHDLKKGKDSAAMFVAGGGRYTLVGNKYTEYLEYCSARDWEGNTFNFTVTVKDDTLIQQGIEKVENIGVERMNIEKYARVRD